MQLARSDRRIYVALDGDILTIYRSVLVTPRSAHYAVVREILTHTCSRLLDSAELADPNMASGRAEYLVFELFSSCPGESLWHLCAVTLAQNTN